MLQKINCLLLKFALMYFSKKKKKDKWAFEGVETHVRPKNQDKPNVTFKVLFSKITVLEGYNITGWTLENALRTQLIARATAISPLVFCFPETDRHGPCCMAVCPRCRSWVPPACPPAVPLCCPLPLCSMFLSLLLSYHLQLPLFSPSPSPILPLLKLFNFHL